MSPSEAGRDPGGARELHAAPERADAPRADGLLLVDKPEGPTSHDIVAFVRRALGARCGHAGTLDPFASGLLVIGAGKATRLLRFLSGADKTYEGTIRLGVATDTDDATGRPLHETRPAIFSDTELAAAVAAQTGAFDQIPPGYSARKQDGVPAYRLARRGEVSSRPPSRVRVVWEECRREGADLLRVRLTVSAGTYIRAIARDLGAALGCGGHLAALRRTRSGPFRVEDAVLVPVERVRTRRPVQRAADGPRPAHEPMDGPRRALQASLLPLEAIPFGLPSETLSEEDVRRVRSGAILARPGGLGSPSGYVRLLGAEGTLVAVAEAEEQG